MEELEKSEERVEEYEQMEVVDVEMEEEKIKTEVIKKGKYEVAREKRKSRGKYILI